MEQSENKLYVVKCGDHCELKFNSDDGPVPEIGDQLQYGQLEDLRCDEEGGYSKYHGAGTCIVKDIYQEEDYSPNWYTVEVAIIGKDPMEKNAFEELYG